EHPEYGLRRDRDRDIDEGIDPGYAEFSVREHFDVIRRADEGHAGLHRVDAVQAVPDGIDERNEDQRHHGGDDRGHEDEAERRVAVAGDATPVRNANRGDRRHSDFAFSAASAMFFMAASTVTCPLATPLMAVFTALENCGYHCGVPCAKSGSTT